MTQVERDDLQSLLRSEGTLLGLFPEVWRKGREYVARCHLHADKTPSLTIFQGRDGVWRWRCFPCAKTGNAVDVLRSQGMSFPQALRELGVAREVKFSRAPVPDKEAYGAKGAPRGKIVSHYNYDDEEHRLLYQVVRLDPKDFRQRRPDGEGGWTWRLGDVRRVLYRLPQLLHRPDDTVYIVEGEKDADRLANMGLVATTNCGGAGNWRPAYAPTLAKRRVVVLPDNDDAGRKHAREVSASLIGVATSITVHHLDVAEKGDVSDWLDAGNCAWMLPR